MTARKSRYWSRVNLVHCWKGRVGKRASGSAGSNGPAQVLSGNRDFSLKTFKARLTAIACALAGSAVLAVPAAHANSAAVDYFRNKADRTAVPSLLTQEEREYYRDLFTAIEHKDWARVQTLFAQKPD